jgi:hypothetical protein
MAMQQKETSTAITLHIPQQDKLPDNGQWTNRFEIHSETSNRVYVIAQHKTERYFGCSCPSWRVHRHCKHLAALSLPAYQQPCEVLAEK